MRIPGQNPANDAVVGMPEVPSRSRFMPLAAAGAALGCSAAQTYSLVCRGDLPAIRLAGCGVWRVERATLEQYLRLASGLTREKARKRPRGIFGLPSEADSG